MIISKFFLNSLDRMVLWFWIIVLIPVMVLGYISDILGTILVMLISIADSKTYKAMARIRRRKGK